MSSPAPFYRNKTVKLIVLFLLIFLLPLAAFAQKKEQNNKLTGNIITVVEGFKNNAGKALIALSDSKENYSSKKKPFKGAMPGIKDKKIEWVFKNIPYGEYAIKVFHDENGNNRLDTNILGIPEEGYGFSNNATGKFGPAKWEDAKFTFNSDNVTLKISVK